MKTTAPPSRPKASAPARAVATPAQREPAATADASAVPELPAPEERLQRAERLGHRIGPQHLQLPAAPRLQRYYTRQNLKKKSDNLPRSVRISENLDIVAADRQLVYATKGKIDEANAVLEAGSKIVLDTGDKQTFEMQVVLADEQVDKSAKKEYLQVVPQFNPDAKSEKGDVARRISPEKGQWDWTKARKHNAYIDELRKVYRDLRALFKEAERGATEPEYAEKVRGLAASDPTEWYGATNKWVQADELRFAVLKLGMNVIAAAYMNEGDVKQRDLDLQNLLRGLETFFQEEEKRPNHIALPTDCGQAVAYIVTGGEPVENDTLADDPAIGSNYYTALPQNEANLGWSYHWAGVILKDGGDNVTLESAGGTSLGSVGKSSWWMQMYGTQKVDQTFKKEIHSLHVLRNRQALENLPATEKNERAKAQLLQQREALKTWTRLDSDQAPAPNNAPLAVNNDNNNNNNVDPSANLASNIDDTTAVDQVNDNAANDLVSSDNAANNTVANSNANVEDTDEKKQ